MSRFKLNTPREVHENPNSKFQAGLNKLRELWAEELLQTFTEMRENQRDAWTRTETADTAAGLIYDKIEEEKSKRK